jgi:hypothetical protein
MGEKVETFLRNGWQLSPEYAPYAVTFPITSPFLVMSLAEVFQKRGHLFGSSVRVDQVDAQVRLVLNLP